MQHEQISAGDFQIAHCQTLFEEVEGRWEVGEEGAPRAEFGFAGALDDDGVVVVGKEGEEGECCFQEGGGWRGWGGW